MENNYNAIIVATEANRWRSGVSYSRAGTYILNFQLVNWKQKNIMNREKMGFIF